MWRHASSSDLGDNSINESQFCIVKLQFSFAAEGLITFDPLNVGNEGLYVHTLLNEDISMATAIPHIVM